MSEKILVAYATKSGSTEEIAQAVAKAFGQEDVPAEARQAEEVESLEGYRAVVLGSPIYGGRLLGEIVRFEKKHRDALATKPRALFVVSLTMARPSEKSIQKIVKRTKRFVEVLKPAAVGLFAGKLNYKGLSGAGWFNRFVMRLSGIPEGDYRNFDFIRKWAKDVLPKLK